MMKNILVKPFQLQSLRAFATASVRSKPYTKPQVLQGPMTFSKMEILNPKDIANATLGADKISSFEELRIFPSVRHAMIEEIKSSYDLKSTYVKDKTELIIKPTVAQIAAIRKMNQVRDTHAKKIQKKQEESFKGNTSRKIFKELISENESNRLKVFNFAAETGSGKTWAFLATLLSKLKEDDVAMFTKSQKKYEEALAERCVRSVILVPTVEMIDQIHGVLTRANQYEFPDSDNKVPGAFKDFLAQPSESRLNIRAFKWCSGVAHTDLFNYIKKHGRVDVLITTPYKLASLEKLVNIERPFQYFNATKYLIIDEADTLMHHNFLTQSEVVLRHLRRLTDIVMCSATVTKDYASTLRKMFPGENSVINIHTQQVHKLSKNIRVKMINSSLAPYNRSKEKCLAQAVYAIYNEGTEAGYVKRMIVFVNSTDAVEPLVTSLTTEFGHRPQDIIGVTGNNTLEDRRARIRPFVEPPVKLEDQADQAKIKVLITTDLLARGVDFNGVKSIINFDLPRRSSDMMHRCGRTGRMGQSGTVYMIVENKTKNSWVKGMKSAIKKRATVL